MNSKGLANSQNAYTFKKNVSMFSVGGELYACLSTFRLVRPTASNERALYSYAFPPPVRHASGTGSRAREEMLLPIL